MSKQKTMEAKKIDLKQMEEVVGGANKKMPTPADKDLTSREKRRAKIPVAGKKM